jgi:tetratricopeptide (TPR) repeat protein
MLATTAQALPPAAPQQAQLPEQLRTADTLRQQHHWPQAIAAYQAILQAHPHLAQAAHHLALCHMGSGQYAQALQAAQLAQRLNSALWQSGLIAAQAQHHMGHGLQALHTLEQLKRQHPQQPLVDLELARRQLHTACHPLASAQAVNHLLNHPSVGAQARQMQLLAQLYDRPAHLSSAQLNQALVQHAQKTLAQPASHADPARRINPKSTPQSPPHKPPTSTPATPAHARA